MEDKTLIRISIFISLIGLVFLFYLSTTEIIGEDVINAEEGNAVKISGKITDIQHKDKITIISVLSPVEVVIFDNTSVIKGNNITIMGDVKEFNGKKEIIAVKMYHS